MGTEASRTTVAPVVTGQIFGRLRTIKREKLFKHKVYSWLCECECGVRKYVREDNLRNGKIKSCGCGRVDWGADRLLTMWEAKKLDKIAGRGLEGITYEKANERRKARPEVPSEVSPLCLGKIGWDSPVHGREDAENKLDEGAAEQAHGGEASEPPGAS